MEKVKIAMEELLNEITSIEHTNELLQVCDHPLTAYSIRKAEVIVVGQLALKLGIPIKLPKI
jgi:hypothetical protein